MNVGEPHTEPRTYRAWTTVEQAGTAVWLVWDVTVRDYPDDKGSYVSGAELHCSASASNPEDAAELGDSEHIQPDDIPGTVLDEVFSASGRDATADQGAEPAELEPDAGEEGGR